MVAQNQTQINELISFLHDYTEGWLEGDDRKLLPGEQIECGFDEDLNEVYCVALTERKEDDPKLLQNGQYHDWRSYDDMTDYGPVVVREIADWKGTLISVSLPLEKVD